MYCVTWDNVHKFRPTLRGLSHHSTTKCATADAIFKLDAWLIGYVIHTKYHIARICIVKRTEDKVASSTHPIAYIPGIDELKQLATRISDSAV